MNPVYGGSFERVMIILVTSAFYLMEHFVVNHVPALGLLLVFLDRLAYNGDVIDGCIVRGKELPVGVQ